MSVHRLIHTLIKKRTMYTKLVSQLLLTCITEKHYHILIHDNHSKGKIISPLL